MGGAKIGSVSMRKPKVNVRAPSGGGVDAGPSVDGDRLRISPSDGALRPTTISGVTMGVKRTIPRVASGKPPRVPASAAARKKKRSILAKTLLGVKRREKKPLTAAQKLQQVARQQYLATEMDRDMEALNGWE
jgi:hypothetical protein